MYVVFHGILLFPPASAVEGIKSVRCVCASVCLLVSALTGEPCDVLTQNFVDKSTLTISRMSCKVKVIGQGCWIEKRDFLSFR